MIIVDLNQVMISNIMALYGKHISNTPIELELFRSTTLNTIRSLYKKFGSQYGEMVIAADGKHSWRKTVFPQYKANRKKVRSNSDIDWQLIFTNLNTIREEIKEYFPYRVIHIDGVEADDVIGTLVQEFSSNPGIDVLDILILSGDKDFIQLQQYNTGVHVVQYDPVNKKFIKSDNPKQFVREHILKGDIGDGIPNILSPDNSFTDSIRQKSLSKKKIELWTLQEPEEFCNDNNELFRNYKRNQLLIDLSMIPNDLRVKIMDEYNAQSGKDKSKIFNYMIKNKLKMLMENINDF
jgi:5'-3' exonuclease